MVIASTYWKKLNYVFWTSKGDFSSFREKAKEKLHVSVQGLVVLERAFLLEKALREQKRLERQQKAELVASCKEQLSVMEEVRKIL